MTPVHRRILQAASLGDKEGLSLLTAAYYQTPYDDRAAFLLEVIQVSDRTKAKLKKLELESLEVKEARIANVVEAAEAAQAGKAQREDLRSESSGGDDEAS